MLHLVKLKDVTLQVEDVGRGIPVVFVHGFPLNRTMWNAQWKSLQEDCRTIVPDLRGFGGSTVTPGTVTMEQMADDLAAMLDAMSITEPIVFCGLSMGGYVAWQFVQRHRKRLQGLILCDTRAAADSPEAAEGRRKTADQVVRLGAQSIAEAMQPKLFGETTMKERPEVVKAVREMILSTNVEGIAAAQRGMAQRPDVSGQLEEIDVPTLVICGEEDRISPVKEMAEIAEKIPIARFVVVPDSGHMTPMEVPEVVNEAIRNFLKDLTAET